MKNQSLNPYSPIAKLLAKNMLTAIACCSLLLACNSPNQNKQELAKNDSNKTIEESKPYPVQLPVGENSKLVPVESIVLDAAVPQQINIPSATMSMAVVRQSAPMVQLEMPAKISSNAELDSETYQTSNNTAQYKAYKENAWKRVATDPVSTFSADVDTASYANVRRFINSGEFPQHDAIRAEEMINYFGYDYAQPKANDATPFSIKTDIVASPWHPDRGLLRIAIKGKDIAKETLPAANLVFLVDVSGSMAPQDRLPLIKSSLKLLTMQLRPQDHVSMVTYADGTRVVLKPTAGDQKTKIIAAIEQLVASGGTNGEAGIKLAYAQAHAGKIEAGINRVLLATDGDLNLGITNPDDLKALVERERKSGIGLSTLGVGNDNYNDALMKQLADAGDGSYHYLDTLQEAHKVLVNEFTSTLAVIAQDLKLQLEFNPNTIDEYRQIGYELRSLTREEFNNDKVDAGDVGAGHTVTALYEIVPRGAKGNADPLRYKKHLALNNTEKANDDKSKNHEFAWLKLRYKQPGKTESTLVEVPINAITNFPAIDTADNDMRFAIAVAGWAQWLRGSPLIGNFGSKEIVQLARSSKGSDPYGHRAEFMRLVELSSTLNPVSAKLTKGSQ